MRATLMPRQFGLLKFRYCVYFNTNGTLRSSSKPAEELGICWCGWPDCRRRLDPQNTVELDPVFAERTACKWRLDGSRRGNMPPFAGSSLKGLGLAYRRTGTIVRRHDGYHSNGRGEPWRNAPEWRKPRGRPPPGKHRGDGSDPGGAGRVASGLR